MGYIEKTDYLKESKEILKDGLIDLGADIDSNTPFRQYINNIDDIYHDYPKVIEEGSNITLKNTRKSKMIIQPKGNTTQNSTTGKNLFNINNYIINDSYIGFDISKLIVGQQYTFSSNLPITWFKISTNVSGYNSVQKADSNGFNNFTFTMTKNSNIPEEETQYLFIGVNGLNVIKDINDLNGYNIQLETGSTATDYEPYTGGTASPNPEYPQTIKNVIGNNKVKIKGKNLWHPNVTFPIKSIISTYSGTIDYDKESQVYTMNGTFMSEYFKIFLGAFDKFNIGDTILVKIEKISGTIDESVIVGGYNNNEGTASWVGMASLSPNQTSNVNVETLARAGMTYAIIWTSPNGRTTTANNFKFRILLAKTDDTATEYEPYIEPIEKELNLKSKNLAWNG